MAEVDAKGIERLAETVKGFEVYESAIEQASAAIAECKLFRYHEWLGSHEISRLAAIEDGWENDPDAVAEVLGIIGGRAFSRDVIEVCCQLWRGGYRTANLAKPF
jgi:hypothetical protein